MTWREGWRQNDMLARALEQALRGHTAHRTDLHDLACLAHMGIDEGVADMDWS